MIIIPHRFLDQGFDSTGGCLRQDNGWWLFVV